VAKRYHKQAGRSGRPARVFWARWRSADTIRLRIKLYARGVVPLPTRPRRPFRMMPTMPTMTMTKRKLPDQNEPDAPASQATSAALPARRPMARATRITLFEREVRERLSRAALDVVFARAERLSEGQRSVRGGRDAYFGSTMLTIDLATFADVFRDACDAGTAHRLATLLESDTTTPRRIREIALREAARIAAARLKDPRTQVAIRAQGAKVFVDVDVEAGY